MVRILAIFSDKNYLTVASSVHKGNCESTISYGIPQYPIFTKKAVKSHLRDQLVYFGWYCWAWFLQKNVLTCFSGKIPVGRLNSKYFWDR